MFKKILIADRGEIARRVIRRAAGRESMSQASRAPCLRAGAGADAALFDKLGLRAMEGAESERVAAK